MPSLLSSCIFVISPAPLYSYTTPPTHTSSPSVFPDVAISMKLNFSVQGLLVYAYSRNIYYICQHVMYCIFRTRVIFYFNSVVINLWCLYNLNISINMKCFFGVRPALYPYSPYILHLNVWWHYTLPISYVFHIRP